MININFKKIEDLTKSFTYSFQDAEPQQSLKIENFRTILFSNNPQDISDDLPGGGSGKNMSKDYSVENNPYEPAITAFFIHLSEQISELKMVDVGALWGHASFVAASMFKTSQIEIFEMNPLTTIYLEKNIALNRSQDSIFNLHNILLSNKDCFTEVTFKHYTARYDKNEGSKPISAMKVARENLKSHINKLLHKKTKGMFKVQKMQVAKLDTILEAINFVPNVIKIDVEGSQYSIIEGSKNIITKNHPVLLIEFDSPTSANYIGKTSRNIIDLLYSWGYSCYWGNHRFRDVHFQKVDSSTNLDIESNSLGIFIPRI